jgi:hypothetical protein
MRKTPRNSSKTEGTSLHAAPRAAILAWAER